MAKKKKTSFRKMVAQNSHKQKSQGDSYNHLRLPKGVPVFSPDVNTRVKLDFLPYEVTSAAHLDRDDEYGIAVPGEYWYKKPYYRHRDIGSGNESMPCPSTDKKPCPICEYRAKLMKEGASWDDDTVRALRPSLRNLYVVVPRGNKNYEPIPHVFDISQFCFQEQLNEEIDEDDAYAVFPDPDEGLTLRVRFGEGKIGKTTFPEASRIDFIDRDKPISDKLLKQAPKLDDILIVPTYAALEAMFYGGLDKASADEEYDDDFDDEDEEVTDDDYDYEDDDVEIDEADEDEIIDDEDEIIDDDDDDFDDEDEDDPADDEAFEDNDYEDEDDDIEEEAPAVKPAPKPKRTAKAAPAKKTAPAAKAKAKAAPASKAASKTTKASAKDKCPHGHRFGVDCEEYDDCDECEIWEECFDAKG